MARKAQQGPTAPSHITHKEKNPATTCVSDLGSTSFLQLSLDMIETLLDPWLWDTRWPRETLPGARSHRNNEIIRVCYWCNHFFFLSFRAMFIACGRSQTGGWIRATAASLHHSHSTPDLSRILDLHHSSRQHQIFNPLRPDIEPTSLWIHFHQVTMRTPWYNFL